MDFRRLLPEIRWQPCLSPGPKARPANSIPICRLLGLQYTLRRLCHVRHVGCPDLSAGDGHPHLPAVSIPLPSLVLALAVGPGGDYARKTPDTLRITETGVRSALRFHLHHADDLGRGRPDPVPSAPSTAPPYTRIAPLSRRVVAQPLVAAAPRILSALL